MNPTWFYTGIGPIFLDFQFTHDPKLENERIKKIRIESNLSQRKFCETLNITQGGYFAIEKGSVFPSRAIVVKLIEVYNLNPTWFYTGVGPMFLEKNISQENISSEPNVQILGLEKPSLITKPMPSLTDNKPNVQKLGMGNVENKTRPYSKRKNSSKRTKYMVPIMPFPARAGYAIEHNQTVMHWDIEEYITISGTGLENAIAFYISGDSMAPLILHNDLVIVKRLQSITFRANVPYIICTATSVVCKKAAQGKEEIALLSDNPDIQPTFIMPTEIEDLYEVMYHIKCYVPPEP